MPLAARRTRLALAALAAAVAWASAIAAYRVSARITFTRDIAPIGFANCTPCHRPGQSGPFELIEYADYREHAQDIADLVEERRMPPWQPSDRNGTFVGQRSLSVEQIQLIRRWVDDGMHEGSASDLPPRPVWPKDWQLGTPDAVLRLDVPYELAAAGPDEYRSFVIAAPVVRQKYVVGWEFKAEGRAIHHAILKIDRMGNARRADAADPGPGFSGMDFDGAQAPDGFYLVWAPGKSPKRVTDGTAWRIDPRSDLVLDLHMRRTGKVERVQPQIALFFSDVPPSERRYSVRIGDPPIDIAPGEKNYRIADSYTLPADVHLLGIFPHAHYRAKTMRIFSRLPDGKQRELLQIPDWDFAWQDEYTFVTPPLLPKGSTLQMEFSYDNSASNLRNPQRPPQRVRGGFQSTDEMGNATFQAMPVRREELDLLLTSKYERQLARSPNAEAHYNLANSLARRGQSAQASDHYRQALALDPSLAVAHVNLAGLLIAGAQFAAAIPHLEAGLELRADDSDARLALGQALLHVGRYADAVAQYERVLAANQLDARAHVMLADAMREHGESAFARQHYEQALRVLPDWPPARTGLALLAVP